VLCVFSDRELLPYDASHKLPNGRLHFFFSPVLFPIFLFFLLFFLCFRHVTFLYATTLTTDFRFYFPCDPFFFG